ncbi:flippase [Ghiorsea bivora]|uniref:flippase n=1 Tax=Ghiorsea bivora TaxID=1485545 RepID=UPI000571336F|nr:flippase [Ghiorsea bivora]
MKDILKGSALIFIFKVLGAASLFGVHLIIARHYGASSLGVFNLVLALITFGTVFSRLGLDMYVLRVIPEIENDKILAAGFIQQVFKLLFVGSIASMFFLMLASSLLDQYIFKSFDAKNYIFALALLMVPFTFFNVIPEIFRGFQDLKVYSLYRNVSQNLLLLITLAGFIYLLGNKPDPVWVLYMVLVGITFVMTFHLYRFLSHKHVNIFRVASYDRKILKYSYPMLFTTSMMFLMGNVDSFMISYYLDETQVGIYAACLKLSLLGTFVLASINGFIAPKISKAYVKQDTFEIKRIYYSSVKIILMAAIPLSLLLIIFSDFFLGLFGEEFSLAYIVLWIVSGTFVVSSAFGPIGYLLNLTDSQELVAKVISISLLVNMILNAVLIPLLGLIGAGVATLTSTLLWNGSLFYYARVHGVLR